MNWFSLLAAFSDQSQRKTASLMFLNTVRVYFFSYSFLSVILRESLLFRCTWIHPTSRSDEFILEANDNDQTKTDHLPV